MQKHRKINKNMYLLSINVIIINQELNPEPLH